ncbi:MAG: hydrogenase expression/formation protein HypE [Elusimicrobia bacterium]|nr:hydrogenase expression/formation protein HypE [Elusimicrobiota bacterium]
MLFENIPLACGSGGRLTSELIKEIFLKNFSNEHLRDLEDSAVLNLDSRNIAFTTDSYVVNPLFFPGGNIGKIAVCGTVNDLSVKGAVPLFISCGFIIEEGFPLETLKKIVLSMKKAAEDAKVKIVTGDTKVVERGKADKLFINTSGVGVFGKNSALNQKNIKPGDYIIVNGDLASHGIAVLNARNNLGIKGDIKSDCAPLNELIHKCVLPYNPSSVRDATRGGLGMILNEAALSCGYCIEIDEDSLPVSTPVKSACDMLGIDPIYAANEGKAVIFISEKSAKNALNSMRKHKYGKKSAIIGKVSSKRGGKVWIKTSIGAERMITMPEGEQLPRIC